MHDAETRVLQMIRRRTRVPLTCETASQSGDVTNTQSPRRALPDVSSPGIDYPGNGVESQSQSSQARSTDIQTTGHDSEVLHRC